MSRSFGTILIFIVGGRLVTFIVRETGWKGFWRVCLSAAAYLFWLALLVGGVYLASHE